MNDNIKPFHAPWNKEGNTFIEFRTERFDDGVGHTGLLTIAVFKTKKGKIAEMDAWIKWDKV